MAWDKASAVEVNVSSPTALRTTTVVSADDSHSVDSVSTLPHVDYPPGSVGAECGFNDFPPFYFEEVDGSLPVNSPYNADDEWVIFESKECQYALDAHINAINPYIWSSGANVAFEFVRLDEPLTFERIFGDPSGDFYRIEAALFNPECKLSEAVSNWDLKENCHAEAFLNYALVNRICFPRSFYADPPILSRQNRANYSESEIQTREQDHAMWLQDIEVAWVNKKCDQVPEILEFTANQYPDLHALVMSFNSPDERKNERALLIELGARFGDEAAGLAVPGFPQSLLYREQGSKYGRFSMLFSAPEWYKFKRKVAPSVERFLAIFTLLSRLDNPDFNKDIEFHWEFVARHLCEPPYPTRRTVNKPNDAHEHFSCQEVVREIRQHDTRFYTIISNVVDKFEQVALEIGVYD